MLKGTVSWTTQEEHFLIQLYAEYGKQYTKLTQLLVDKFSNEKQKFNVNRVNSKLNTLMRQGLMILIKKTEQTHQSFQKLINHMSTSKIILSVSSLDNDDHKDAKVKLLALKFYENETDENDIEELVNLVQYTVKERTQQQRTQMSRPEQKMGSPFIMKPKFESKQREQIMNPGLQNYKSQLNPSMKFGNDLGKGNRLPILNHMDMSEKGVTSVMRGNPVMPTKIKPKSTQLRDILKANNMTGLRNLIKEKLKQILMGTEQITNDQQ